MTNDQAIRVALEAAAKAMCGPEEPNKIVRRFVGDHPIEMTLWQSYEDDVAAAIAAFLRALPVGSGKGMFEFGDDDEVLCLSMKEAAAAVERAASAGEGEGHG